MSALQESAPLSFAEQIKLLESKLVGDGNNSDQSEEEPSSGMRDPLPSPSSAAHIR
jgi:hypothetical protein